MEGNTDFLRPVNSISSEFSNDTDMDINISLDSKCEGLEWNTLCKALEIEGTQIN